MNGLSTILCSIEQGIILQCSKSLKLFKLQHSVAGREPCVSNVALIIRLLARVLAALAQVQHKIN